MLLNRRRLSVSLDWHCYRADRSQINVQHYNQWLEHVDFARFAEFDIWRGDESEYDDFRKVSQLSQKEFIVASIRDLLPLYEACHQVKP